MVKKPMAQKVAMWLVKSQTGLRLSLKGAKKAADTQLDGFANRTIQVPRRDGSGQIRVRVYAPADAAGPLPVVLYFHGGGYATGWPERHHALYARLMQTRPCVIVAPAFRSSLDAPYPAGHDDCYDTLLWLRDNAASIGGDPARLVLGGNSSGGGMALSAALRARDEDGPSAAFLMPLYPIIDDRPDRWTTVDRAKVTWSKGHNILAWHLLMRDVRARKTWDIPAYAAPARATDLSGLPPTLTYVGEDDILMAETVAMCHRLQEAGVEVTSQVIPTTFHAMEDSVPDAPRSKEIHAWLTGRFAQMMDRYC